MNMQNLIDWILANPYRTGFYLAAIAGFIAGPLEAFTPRGAAFLRALGMHVPGAIRAFQEAQGKSDGPKPPAPPMVALIAVCAFGVTSCASGTQAIEAIAHAGRDVAVAAEPCLVATYDDQLRQCAEAEAPDACKQAAAERWAPVLASLDTLHAAWCAVAPTSEGCP